ncbi:hypothetical protein FB384_001977 [Prauserella sediminis]|uniref:Uncharacterized protein n=1 Tax=Prauserella sediminis TaxID=577680 RepID=A0A839XR17_9PSEU|nr:hypothetical protein [Prauserella sediminis]
MRRAAVRRAAGSPACADAADPADHLYEAHGLGRAEEQLRRRRTPRCCALRRCRALRLRCAVWLRCETWRSGRPWQHGRLRAHCARRRRASHLRYRRSDRRRARTRRPRTRSAVRAPEPDAAVPVPVPPNEVSPDGVTTRAAVPPDAVPPDGATRAVAAQGGDRGGARPHRRQACLEEGRWDAVRHRGAVRCGDEAARAAAPACAAAHGPARRSPCARAQDRPPPAARELRAFQALQTLRVFRAPGAHRDPGHL